MEGVLGVLSMTDFPLNYFLYLKFLKETHKTKAMYFFLRNTYSGTKTISFIIASRRRKYLGINSEGERLVQ